MRRMAVGCVLALCSAVHAGESRAVAALLSAILPGAGQAYLGWRAPAEGFLIAEGAVWGGRLYCLRRASGLRDSYIAYGASHAGSDPAFRDEAYYDDMARYWNSERANQHYQDPHRYSGSKVWSWQTFQERKEFSALVRDRRHWDSTASNVLALAILTRAASVVHCLKAGSHHRVGIVSDPTQVGLSLRW